MKQRHDPIRSCVVCRTTSDKRTLLRVVRLPEKLGGALAIDSTGKAPGRGAYLCVNVDCIDKAAKGKRIERALSVNLSSAPADLYQQLRLLAEKSAEDPTTSTRSKPPMK